MGTQPPCKESKLPGETTGGGEEESITILNIYASNIGASQYIKQMLTTIKEGNQQ